MHMEDDNEDALTIDEDGNAATVDLSGVDEDSGGFEPVPRGIYSCNLIELDYKISQSGGNPMWTWCFEVTDGEYATRRFWYHTTFIPKSLPMLKKTLLAVGREDLATTAFDPQDEEIMQSLIGVTADLKVDLQKAYQGGGQSNNVKAVMPASEGGDDFLEG